MSPEISTRALIDVLAEGTEGEALTLGGMLDQFRTRAYGIFLLVSLLPAFVPLPVGAGAVSGPLVCLIGLQLLAQMAHPWVPAFMARRPLSRENMTRFRNVSSKWLGRLEKVSRPRNELLIDHFVARSFTGLLLVLLGVLLALPIPGTNYPFGFILLAYAIALIERDGRLMAIAWVLGIAEIVVLVVFSSQVAHWAAGFFS